MVTRYGMDEKLGYVAYEEPRSAFLDQEIHVAEKKYSEATARQIDMTVRNIISNCFDRAMSILNLNREVLETCVAELLKTERLEEDKLRELTRPVKKFENDATAHLPT